MEKTLFIEYYLKFIIENDEIKNSSKMDYINLTMASYFGEDIMQQCFEFSYNLLSTQSLCYLLHFLNYVGEFLTLIFEDHSLIQPLFGCVLV